MTDYSLYALLWLNRDSEKEISDLLRNRCGIDKEYIQRGMHLTIYHSKKKLIGIEDYKSYKEIKADIKPTINNEEQMNEFSFAKELGKLEAQFESMTNKYAAQIEALENENSSLLEVMTSFEEKFAGVEDLKSALEMIQKHIESMEAPKEEEDVEEVMEEKPEEAMEEKPVVEEEVIENRTEEKYSSEEKANELEVEEQFAAEQIAEEVSNSVEDKTVVFNAITPEKIDIINKFFSRR